MRDGPNNWQLNCILKIWWSWWVFIGWLAIIIFYTGTVVCGVGFIRKWLQNLWQKHLLKLIRVFFSILCSNFYYFARAMVPELGDCYLRIHTKLLIKWIICRIYVIHEQVVDQQRCWVSSHSNYYKHPYIYFPNMRWHFEQERPNKFQKMGPNCKKTDEKECWHYLSN